MCALASEFRLGSGPPLGRWIHRALSSAIVRRRCAVIRRLAHADVGAFRELRRLGLELHPEAFGTDADAWRNPSDEAVEATLGVPGAASERFVMGAIEEGCLVGALGFRRESRPALRHKGSLWGFIVRPEHRRKGHGAALLDAVLDELRRDPGLGYVRLVVTSNAAEAIRLFESRGFVSYAVEKGGLHHGGRAFD